MPSVLARALLGTVVVLALGWPGAALAQEPGASPAAGSSPSPAPTPLVPLPDPPDPEPTGAPQPTAEPEETSSPEAQEPSPSPSPRRARRSPTPSPVPAPTRVRVAATDGALPTPTDLPSDPPSVLASPGPARDPLDVGLAETEPSPTPAPATASPERPTDPLTRGLQVALGGAVLLGLAGGTGLYLTRERR